MRGYCAIGIQGGKNSINIGTLWRSAQALGAAYIFTVGRRYPKQSSDTTKAWRHLPTFEYDDIESFLTHRPKDCLLVGIECGLPKTKPLPRYAHPERAIYVLGAEDRGLDPALAAACTHLIEIPTSYCLNVATAGAIVLYDRASKELGK